MFRAYKFDIERTGQLRDLHAYAAVINEDFDLRDDERTILSHCLRVRCQFLLARARSNQICQELAL
jgi:hypothetical protein